MPDSHGTSARPRVLLVTPIAPADTGNGLAMRAGLLVEGLSRCADVVLAVVPVAQPDADEDALHWARERVADAILVPPPTGAEAVTGWVAHERGRELVARAETLPERARRAPPELGRRILHRVGSAFDAVWLLRGYLAGVAAPFVDRSPRPRLVLDLDEDDETTLASVAALHRSRGEEDAAERAAAEARSCGRMLDGTLPWFDRVLVASSRERSEVLARRDVAEVSVLPNAVRTRQPSATPDDARRGAVRLLLVGNFDYVPNRDAAERLVRDVLPAVRRVLPDARLDLVGAGTGLPSGDGVVVHGFSEHLGEAYRRATATVVPLRAGGGSRLKILEALAEGLPVVATPEAVRGLDVRSGEHCLVESGAEALARAVIRLHREPEAARALTRAGLSFVRAHHDRDAVAESLSDLCAEDLRGDSR